MRAAAVVVAAGLVLVACASKASEVNQPSQTTRVATGAQIAPDVSAIDTSPTATLATSTTQPSAAVAHVGATLYLTTQTNQPFSVTLDQVMVGVQSDLDGVSPDQGDQFIGVRITILNTGSHAFEDDPNADTKLLDLQNQGYDPDFTTLAGCQFIGNDVRLGPGERQTGCITFQIPVLDRPAKFQYAPSSAFANDFGEWLIP